MRRLLSAFTTPARTSNIWIAARAASAWSKIMGAADDIKQGLIKASTTFTKQRKAEKKQSSAGRWRRSRMVEARGEFLTEASDAIMEEAYLKASDNNTLPATARQVFY